MNTQTTTLHKHTPTPWHADGRCIQAQDGNIGLLNLARDDRTTEANAAFIVRAVNSHQALVEALELVAREWSGSLRTKATPAEKAVLAALASIKRPSK